MNSFLARWSGACARLLLCSAHRPAALAAPHAPAVNGFRARWGAACAALLLCSAHCPAALAADDAPAGHHMLWSLQGKTNKVYLLGSFHLLKATETLPAAMDAAYADAEALVMEIDMDD